jgi:hypothetical protein
MVMNLITQLTVGAFGALCLLMPLETNAQTCLPSVMPILESDPHHTATAGGISKDGSYLAAHDTILIQAPIPGDPSPPPCRSVQITAASITSCRGTLRQNGNIFSMQSQAEICRGFQSASAARRLQMRRYAARLSARFPAVVGSVSLCPLAPIFPIMARMVISLARFTLATHSVPASITQSHSFARMAAGSKSLSQP